MIEPFCSIYTKHYRFHEREPEVESIKPCLPYKDFEGNFLPAEDSKIIYNEERDEGLIKELYLTRLMSTYQKSYCCAAGKKSMVIDPNNLEADQFMVNFNNYYAKKTQPVMRPLDSARTINGYSRFDYYYTGKSVYEETIGREGYNFFKRDYDMGKSRLFKKKQHEMNVNKEKEPDSQKEGDPVEEKNEKAKIVQETETEATNEKICRICCKKFIKPPKKNT